MPFRHVVVFTFALACCGSAIAQSVLPPKVVAPEDVAVYWTMIHSSVEVDVPYIAKRIDQPGCATVSFVVSGDGNTNSITVQRVLPDGDFRQIAQSMAENLHFEPAVSNVGRKVVMSWLIFPFNLPADPAARAVVMRPCAAEKLDAKTS